MKLKNTILLQMLPSKDANFVGYTYKNFEIVNDDEVAGIGQLSLNLAHPLHYFTLFNKYVV
jgi:predicted permease